MDADKEEERDTGVKDLLGEQEIQRQNDLVSEHKENIQNRG